MMGILGKDAEDGNARKEETGRPKMRFMDAVRERERGREDIALSGVTEEDAEDRTEWRWKIRCGNP